MSKKDLANLTTDPAAVAAMLPPQRSIAGAPPVDPVSQERKRYMPRGAVLGPPSKDTGSQFSLSLRKSLRKQLAKLAAEADMTMRAFVLDALKDRGLAVRDDDLADLRRR